MKRLAPRIALAVAAATVLAAPAAVASAQVPCATWSNAASGVAWSPAAVAASAPACASYQLCATNPASMTAGAYPTYVFHASSAPIYAPAVSCNLPAACPAPSVSAIAPLPATAYVAAYPAPYAAYRAPYSAVVGGRTVIVRPKVYVPGQPVRNFFRAITP